MIDGTRNVEVVKAVVKLWVHHDFAILYLHASVAVLRRCVGMSSPVLIGSCAHHRCSYGCPRRLLQVASLRIIVDFVLIKIYEAVRT